MLPSAGLAKAPGRTAWVGKDEQVLGSALIRGEHTPNFAFGNTERREMLAMVGHQNSGEEESIVLAVLWASKVFDLRFSL